MWEQILQDFRAPGLRKMKKKKKKVVLAEDEFLFSYQTKSINIAEKDRHATNSNILRSFFPQQGMGNCFVSLNKTVHYHVTCRMQLIINTSPRAQINQNPPFHSFLPSNEK